MVLRAGVSKEDGFKITNNEETELDAGGADEGQKRSSLGAEGDMADIFDDT